MNNESGTIVISGNAVVAAHGGAFGAGIGGGYNSLSNAITITQNATVTADSDQGSGIGGGYQRSNGPLTISGSAVVTATSRKGGAGIGAGWGGDGGTTTISGTAHVTASSGPDPLNGNVGGAGIGGGFNATGGSVSISGSAVVSATGGPNAAAIGTGGGHLAAGSFSLADSATVTTTTQGTGNALGGSVNDPGLGTVAITGGTLIIPAGSVFTLPTSINNNGIIINHGLLNGAGPLVNSSSIVNDGTVSVASLTGHNYSVTLDAQAGALTGSNTFAVRAGSVASSGQTLPAPVLAGFTFTGWNRVADGSGTTVGTSTDIGLLLGSSSGSPVSLPLFARYVETPLTTTTASWLSASASGYGAAVSASAHIAAGATGILTFLDGTTTVGNASVTDGFASVLLPRTLTPGTHSISAVYSGDALHTASSSSASVLSISKASPKITVSGSKFKMNSKPKVKVVIAKLSNGETVTGKVTIYIGSKKVSTVTVKKTSTTITLPKKYSKAISVKAKFLGSSTVAVTSSKTVTVKTK